MNKALLLSILFLLFFRNSYSQNPIIDSVVTKTLFPDTLQVTVYGQLPYTGCTGIMLVMTNISFPNNLINIKINIDCPDTGNWIYSPFMYPDFIGGFPAGNYSLCVHLCARINFQTYCDSTCKTVVMSVNNIYNKTEIFSITPNPTSGSFTISLSETTQGEVFIYNPLGECIYKSLILNPNSLIDISSRPRGIYFLKVQSADGKIYTEKIILSAE